MALGIKTESYGGGDMTWLGSRHGVDTATTITLDASAFTVDDDIVPSGYPVQKSSTPGLADPYDDEAGTLYGFVIGDHDISGGDTPVAVVWHGRINVANVPVAGFEAPTDPGLFDFT